MKRRRWLLFVIIALVIAAAGAGVYAWRARMAAGRVGAATRQAAMSVMTTIPVQRRDIVQTVTATARCSRPGR
jgi:hypothetical protein